MIISASRRTDVPGFHAKWFLNRVRAGWCHWLHPYNAQIRRVSLAPEDVTAFVFWTRRPHALLPHLGALRQSGYPMLFQFTINGYGPPLESHNPPVDSAIDAARQIAHELGPDAVLWRYDPILLTEDLTEDAHVRRFTALAAELRGVSRRCTFSFVDFYGKTQRNLRQLADDGGPIVGSPGAVQRARLAARLADVARAHGMEFLSCCDDSLVAGLVGKSRCVDPAAVAAVAGARPSAKAAPTRKDCGCVRSVDIGTYDTCAFGCRYCYAVTRRETAIRRLKEADPRDSLIWRPPSLRGRNLENRESPLVGAAGKN